MKSVVAAVMVLVVSGLAPAPVSPQNASQVYFPRHGRRGQHPRDALALGRRTGQGDPRHAAAGRWLRGRVASRRPGRS